MIYDLNLNIIPDGNIPIVHISQYDTDRILHIYPRLNGEAYAFDPQNTTFWLYGKRPDKENFDQSIDIHQDGYIYLTLTEEAAAIPGDVYCIVEMIESGTNRTGSQAFILRVQEDAKGDL